jgi:hypothetical protein
MVRRCARVLAFCTLLVGFLATSGCQFIQNEFFVFSRGEATWDEAGCTACDPDASAACPDPSTPPCSRSRRP